jgi:hypothetical protein
LLRKRGKIYIFAKIKDDFSPKEGILPVGRQVDSVNNLK